MNTPQRKPAAPRPKRYTWTFPHSNGQHVGAIIVEATTDIDAAANAAMAIVELTAGEVPLPLACLIIARNAPQVETFPIPEMN